MVKLNICTILLSRYYIFSSTKGDWDVLLPTAKFALNMTYSATTGYSPAFVLYGCELVLSFDCAICCLVVITIASAADHL